MWQVVYVAMLHLSSMNLNELNLKMFNNLAVIQIVKPIQLYEFT